MFRTINRRHQEAIEFAGNAREFKEQVQERLARRLATLLRNGETLPDLTLFQELVARLLEEGSDAVLAIDKRYTSNLVDAGALRDERDRLTADLRIRLRDLRLLVDRSIGGAAVKAALRDRRLSYIKPSLLVAAARNLVELLRDPQHAWDETDRNTALFATAAKAADTVEAEADELEQVLLRLSPQLISSQNGRGVKTAEIEAVADTNKRCKDALYGLYRLAGLDYHAERLRPKVRRRSTGDPDPTEPNPSPPMALERVH